MKTDRNNVNFRRKFTFGKDRRLDAFSCFRHNMKRKIAPAHTRLPFLCDLKTVLQQNGCLRICSFTCCAGAVVMASCPADPAWQKSDSHRRKSCILLRFSPVECFLQYHGFMESQWEGLTVLIWAENHCT